MSLHSSHREIGYYSLPAHSKVSLPPATFILSTSYSYYIRQVTLQPTKVSLEPRNIIKTSLNQDPNSNHTTKWLKSYNSNILFSLFPTFCSNFLLSHFLCSLSIFFLLLAKCIHPARTQCMPAFFHMLRSFLRPSMHAAFLSQFNFTEVISFSSLISSLFVTWQLLRQCHQKSIWRQLPYLCTWRQLPYLCTQPTSHTSPFFYIQSVWTQDAQDRSQSPSINGPLFLRCLIL